MRRAQKGKRRRTKEKRLYEKEIRVKVPFPLLFILTGDSEPSTSGFFIVFFCLLLYHLYFFLLLFLFPLPLTRSIRQNRLFYHRWNLTLGAQLLTRISTKNTTRVAAEYLNQAHPKPRQFRRGFPTSFAYFFVVWCGGIHRRNDSDLQLPRKDRDDTSLPFLSDNRKD